MNPAIRVLFIEDNPHDARLLRAELERAGLASRIQLVWADRLEQGLEAFKMDPPDAILLDLSLPDSHGLETLERILEVAAAVPVIVMTGRSDEALATEAMQIGAQDYLVKGQLDGSALMRAIRYAIERKRVELQLRELTGIVEHSEDVIFRKDLDGIIRSWNKGAERVYGYRPEEVIGKPVSILMPPENAGQMAEIMEEIRRGERVQRLETERVRKDGTRILLSLTVSPIRDSNGKIVAASTIAHDITAERQAETAVRTMQDRLRALTENAPDGVALIDPAGQMKFISPAGRRILGYDPDEEVELNPMGGTHPDDLPSVFGVIANLIEHPTQAPTLQYRFRRKDDSWVWIESTFTNMLAVDSVEAIVINFRDITDRKEAEQKITFQARLLGAVGSAVIATDLNGVVMYWNAAAEKMYGWSTVEALGRLITDLTPSLQSREESLAIMAQLAQGEPWSGEFLVRRRDGWTFPAFVSNSPIQDASGNLIGIIGVSSDITPLKQAEQALRESEHRFRALIENSADAIMLLDEQGFISFESPAASRILGYEPGDMLGRAPTDFIHPDDVAQAGRLLGSLLQTPGGVVRAELRYLPKAGDPGWVEATGTNLLADPNVQAIVVNYRDVTPRKQALEDLRRLNERFRIAAHAARLGVWDWDIDKNVLVWDEQMHRLYGNEGGSLESAYTTWLDVLHPDDRQRSDATVRQALEGDGSYETEFRVIWPDHSVRYLKAYGQVLFGEDRRPLRMSGVNFDITERKQAELEVQEKVTALQALGELQREISAAFDVNTILQLLCERLVGLLRVPKAAIAVRDASMQMQLTAHYGMKDPALTESEFLTHWTRDLFPREPLLHGTVARSQIAPQSTIMAAFRAREHIEALALAPLLNGEMIMGALVVFDTRPRHWTDQEIQMLELLSGQAAIALEKIRLLNQEKQRRAELTALYHLSEKLGESNDFDEVLRIVVKKAVEVLHITFARILLLEDEQFTVYAHHPLRELPLEPVPFTLPAALMPFTAGQLAASEVSIIDQEHGAVGEDERRLLLLHYAKSLCLVPLKVRGLPLGVLVLGEARHQAREPINEDKIRLATSIGEQTSSAIQRTQLYKETQQRLLHLQALTTIDQAISSSFDLRLVLMVLTQQAKQQLEIDAVAAHLFNPIEQKLEYVAGTGLLSNEIANFKLRVGEGVLGRVALERRMRIEPDLTITEGLKREALIFKEGFVSYCAAPLIAKGKLVGVLEAFHRSPFRFSPEWVSFYQTLAGQAGIAIDNAQMFESLQRANVELERRVAERTAELNRTNVELEHANRAKDEFLATMSHELRTPLNSILGLSETLLEQRRGDLNPYQEKSLHIIESSGRHLLDLINDILDLSKIEAGKSDYYPQPVIVEDVCRSCLGFVKAQANKKSIAVTYINEAAGSRIYADPRRLKQILVNLLSNAVKFTPDRGQVTLRVDPDPDGDLIEFSVIDTGIGIAPEDLQRLFQPFVQVDSRLNRGFDGTGLGLFLVQKLVDMHGGSVEVESEMEQGSRFSVKIPWGKQFISEPKNGGHEAGAASPQAASAAASSDLQNHGLILLAEDNMASVLMISEYLEGHGYEVRVAHDGLEATQMAEEIRPAVILMDIQMPVMDGLEAMRRLRALPHLRRTPIVALTALAMPGDRVRCLEAGADEYMSKPVQLKKLLQMIAELVTQKL